MPVSTENIRRWIEKSDIDYVTYFIKAWIPFNAWYNSHHEPLDSDRAKINATKNNSNPVRNGINSYLESNGQPSELFKTYLSDLHYSLQENQLDGKEGRISFHEIVKEKNQINLIDNEKIGKATKYYLKREDGRHLGEVTQIQVHVKNNNNQNVFSYQHAAYDLMHLQATADFQNLSVTRRENARICFERIKPIIVIDALRNPHDEQEEPKNYYKCDSYKFVRDVSNPNCYGQIVCKGVIETLYQLRNILFHGELLPTEAIQPIYKNAYFLLKMILEKVK
jgi:hypothetical protein